MDQGQEAGDLMKVLTVAGVSLKRLFRDRTALFFTMLFPALIILLVGVSIFKQAEGGIKVGVAQLSDGPLARELVTEIDATKALQVERFETQEALQKAVRREAVIAGVVVPSRYDAELKGDGVGRLVFLGAVGTNTPAAVRSTISSIAARQGGLVKAARFAAKESGGTFDENLRRAKALEAETERLTIDPSTVGVADNFPTGFSYPAASQLVLFVFINSLVGAGALILMRQQGISRRMLSTPTSARAILLGQTLGRFSIALFQGVLIFVLGIVVFDVKWGDALGTSALIFCFALVGTGVGMLMGTVFRTPEQASSVGPPLGIALGMLGGCMWPLEIVSETMKTVGHLTPHAWAMDGFIALMSRGATVVDIAPKLGILLAFAVVLLTISTIRLRRSITA